ncbi:MAG TPA: tetratricopeptide repeat protein [Candidatus Limnocylindria bacterium]|jgi:hypothetical protein|nr:tetratricopeptide repeat protein [Candidatus Limnocylindria bacterium]
MLFNPHFWLSSPLFMVLGIFQIWMAIDAARRREWVMMVFCLLFPVWGAGYYYFNYYRGQGPASALTGFELPGAGDRRRIKEIQTQIHHLDNARNHFDLADIYFRRGEFAKAEISYRESLTRDPKDIDAMAHYGQCLLRMNRAADGLPFLEYVHSQQPRHEYGYTAMALAEAYAALGKKDAAMKIWERVLESNTYARARVQYAGLLLEKGQKKEAQEQLQEAISDFEHAPRFSKRQSRPWIRKAKGMLSSTRA